MTRIPSHTVDGGSKESITNRHNKDLRKYPPLCIVGTTVRLKIYTNLCRIIAKTQNNLTETATLVVYAYYISQFIYEREIVYGRAREQFFVSFKLFPPTKVA